MKEGLREFLRQTPEAVFAFCGNRNLGHIWKKSIRIPDDQWLFLEGDEFDGYQTRISQFDIGVAPLRYTKFNTCKSDLRLLEYGAWGVPYVASDITPYRRFYEQSNGYGGFLASTPAEWTSRLTYWANNDDPRDGGLLRQHVRQKRGNRACGEKWEECLTTIMGLRSRSSEGTTCQAI